MKKQVQLKKPFGMPLMDSLFPMGAAFKVEFEDEIFAGVISPKGDVMTMISREDFDEYFVEVKEPTQDVTSMDLRAALGMTNLTPWPDVVKVASKMRQEHAQMKTLIGTLNATIGADPASAPSVLLESVRRLVKRASYLKAIETVVANAKEV